MMYRFRSMVLFSCLLFFAAPLLAQSPAKVAQHIIDIVSASGDLKGIYDYLDWDGAYERLSHAEKKQMGYRSVNDFRRATIHEFEKRATDVTKGLKNSLKAAHGPQKKKVEKMQETLERTLREQEAALLDAYRTTLFSIGAVTADGDDAATVELQKLKNGNRSISALHFRRIGGEWKLVSAAPLNLASSYGGSNSLTHILGVSMRSPDVAVVRPF